MTVALSIDSTEFYARWLADEGVVQVYFGKHVYEDALADTREQAQAWVDGLDLEELEARLNPYYGEEWDLRTF